MKKEGKKSMTVKGKLTMFTVIIMVIIIALSAVSIFITQLVNSARAERYNVYGEGQINIINAMNSFNRVRVQTRNMLYVYEDDIAKRDEAVENTKTFFDDAFHYLDEFDNYLDQYGSDVKETYDACYAGMEDFQSAMNDIYTMLDANDIEGARQKMNDVCLPASNIVNDNIIACEAAIDAESDEKNAVINTEVTALTLVIVVVCVVGAVITLVYCVTLIRTITNPVAQLSEASRKMAKGDVNIELHKLANDDLGMLMDDFLDMAAEIRSQVEVASKIADGDMTVEVNPRSPEDLLGNALKKLVKDNDSILSDVKDSTMQVTVGADEVAAASQALAQGATEQASALEEVTASMDEIAQRTKQNAEQANEANDRVNTIKNMATSGNDQMKSLIGAMNDINESSDMISKIIKTIDDISFQTNILALNAAVEAARAGVHGKGFAVVAEEVRNLAAKSAAAASETSEMIEDTIHKINNGTQLAESTAKALDEIVDSIDKIVELIGAIASASNEQATSVNQVDQAIDQVSQVVQTNSATSQECAASSAELSTQASNLRALVAHYKLTTGGDHDGKAAGGHEDSHFGGDKNEQIISLDGEFGKY